MRLPSYRGSWQRRYHPYPRVKLSAHERCQSTTVCFPSKSHMKKLRRHYQRPIYEFQLEHPPEFNASEWTGVSLHNGCECGCPKRRLQLELAQSEEAEVRPEDRAVTDPESKQTVPRKSLTALVIVSPPVTIAYTSDRCIQDLALHFAFWRRQLSERAITSAEEDASERLRHKR
jgi:hypothetical protein